jgi:hypothetical protein
MDFAERDDGREARGEPLVLLGRTANHADSSLLLVFPSLPQIRCPFSVWTE